MTLSRTLVFGGIWAGVGAGFLALVTGRYAVSIACFGGGFVATCAGGFLARRLPEAELDRLRARDERVLVGLGRLMGRLSGGWDARAPQRDRRTEDGAGRA